MNKYENITDFIHTKFTNFRAWDMFFTNSTQTTTTSILFKIIKRRFHENFNK